MKRKHRREPIKIIIKCSTQIQQGKMTLEIKHLPLYNRRILSFHTFFFVFFLILEKKQRRSFIFINDVISINTFLILFWEKKSSGKK